MDYINCPECGNRYKFGIACPNCTPSLQEMITLPPPHQSVAGDGIQSVQIGGHNHGPINIGHDSDGRIAHFELNTIKQYSSLWALLKPTVYATAISGIAFVLGMLDSWVTILGFFGVEPAGREFFGSLIPLAALFVIIAGVYFLFHVSSLAFDDTDWVRLFHHHYEKEDGAIVKKSITGQCPVVGCEGRLYLARPPANEEGYFYVAMCSQKGIHHAFEYNDRTLKGPRIRITPKKNSK